MEKICIIGGGITGLFSALNLSLNGYNVTLFEKNDILSGTSGKFHGMLHSGSRYSVNDPESARECINENKILSNFASRFIKDTGGYYVSLNREEEEYGDILIKSNKKTGIETEEVNVEDLISREPYVNHAITRALKVPDKIINAHTFASSVAIESIMNGAKIKTNSEIISSEIRDNEVVSISYKKNNKIVSENFDFVINTTGPWSGNVLKNFNIKDFEIMPTLGYMASYDRVMVNSIINRMREPSDGDIILPYGPNTVAGTVAIISENPDSAEIEDDDIDMMISEIAEMIPSLKKYHYQKLYHSMRPLIKDEKARGSRDFNIFNNYNNMISVIGGKFTTSRIMGRTISETLEKYYGVKTEDTSKLNFNATFEKFIDINKNNVDMEFIGYLNSYDNGMDYMYKDQILGAYLLKCAIEGD